MSLFGKIRDINLFKSVNRELIHNIIEQQVGYYKFKLDETKINIYGESLNKTLVGPILIQCLIERGDASWKTEDGNPNFGKLNKFRFLKDDLVDANVVPETGDVILWNEMYFEVDGLNENQLIVGKDTDYSYTDSVRDYGSSFSIIVEAHYANPERWGLQKQRL
jgi:hypothetical protein